MLKTSNDYWRYLRWILLLAAVAHHVFFQAHYSRLGWDELRQLAQARSFIVGQNFAVATANPDDLAQVDYTVEVHFPIGYSALLAAGLMAHDNAVFVDFFWQAAATVLFFGAWFAILELSGQVISIRARLFIWLWWALASPPLMVGAWTDHATTVIPLALFSCNMALIALALRSGQRVMALSAAGGLLVGLGAAMHYTLWPLAAATPLAVVCYGWFYTKRRGWWLTVATANATGAGIIIAGLLLYNWTFTGALFDAQFPFSGANWDHLLRIVPFPLATLGLSHPRFFFGRLEQVDMVLPPALPVETVAGGLSFAIIGLFGVALWRSLRHRERVSPLLAVTLLTGAWTLVILLVFLGYRSVFMMLDGYAGGWVFLQELRYFAPVLPFLMLGVALVLFQPAPEIAPSHFVFRAGAWLVLALIFVSVAGWRVDLTWRQITRPDDFRWRLGESYYDNHPIINAVSHARADGLPVVVIYTGNAADVWIHARAAGASVLEVPQITPDMPLNSSQPVRVLVVTSAYVEPLILSLEQFADASGAELVGYEPYRTYSLNIGDEPEN